MATDYECCYGCRLAVGSKVNDRNKSHSRSCVWRLSVQGIGLRELGKYNTSKTRTQLLCVLSFGLRCCFVCNIAALEQQMAVYVA